MDLPLHGLTVLEFGQYLSAPYAGLRLADLGARVIKIERPDVGDAGRKLAIKDLWIDDSSLLFHTINRNKESFTADIKDEKDRYILRKIIDQADVLIHNFRPGVMGRAGLSYEQVKISNPGIVYGAISGYGETGVWRDKPGQDLLIQSMSGLTWTTGNAADPPTPFGVSIGDILCGTQLVQGILGALIRRQKTGVGALIEVSILETLIDFQFELFTTYFASGKLPQRSGINNGHPLLSAPYGIYETSDGFLSLAMMDLQVLADAINCPSLKGFNKSDLFKKRDEIKLIISKHLKTEKSSYWLGRLKKEGLWCMEVYDWKELVNHDAYKVLEIEQTIDAGLKSFITTRCPIRFNGERIFSKKPAPSPGEDNEVVLKDFIYNK